MDRAYPGKEHPDISIKCLLIRLNHKVHKT